ncbi:DUF72 domain-containing protein [Ramlibacter sp. WS9]|uniref:DUF72 domain-containing protein n=1 Tax=Ramlibacter sp. WS9 TaxID=1882741 RepID=UPI001143B504|nr:DUF72 domain-containing protein [Ramlibacter sp. WS9]ROZ76621.1 DUF72 domain-containing protein [Ramlibacter sp. WS9]
MNNILIGSASWTDKTLIECGRFYPKECKSAEARLRHYATQFPIVEVDSSYYGMPTPANAQLWAERTPEHFTFNIKAFRLFTGHQTSPTVLHKDLQQALGPDAPKVLYYKDTPKEIADELWRRFSEAVEPLRQAGKLGALHFQFAPWLLRNREGMAHVAHCVEKMQGHLLAVEFRNKSWFDGDNLAKTVAFERELGVAHTIVDGPQGFANCVPLVWEATHPALALLRLHGRNHDTWNIKSSASSSRFNYWYSQAELAAMVPEIRRMASLADALHVVFNTNYEDQGQVNAKLLMSLLR